MAIRKRKVQANYLKVKEAFELLGAGFTELNESPSAQIGRASCRERVSVDV